MLHEFSHVNFVSQILTNVKLAMGDVRTSVSTREGRTPADANLDMSLVWMQQRASVSRILNLLSTNSNHKHCNFIDDVEIHSGSGGERSVEYRLEPSKDCFATF